MYHSSFVFFIVLSALGWGATSADQAILNMRVSVLGISGAIEFFDVCNAAHVPCGLEYSILDNSRFRPAAKEPTRVSDYPLKKLLDRIVLRDPRYLWTIEEGVINLIPKAVVEDKKRYSSPLDRTIDSVDLVDTPLDDAAAQISRSARISCGNVAESIAGRPAVYRRVTLHLRNIALRDALNELVRADGRAGWQFTRGHRREDSVSADKVYVVQW